MADQYDLILASIMEQLARLSLKPRKSKRLEIPKATRTLLTLPPELRLIIWEYALIDTLPIPLFVEKQLTATCPATGAGLLVTAAAPPPPRKRRRFDKAVDNRTTSSPDTASIRTAALLHTCRLTRAEGHRIYFSENTFLLRADPFPGSVVLLQRMYATHQPFLRNLRTLLIEYVFILPPPTLVMARAQILEDTRMIKTGLAPSFDLELPLTATQYDQSNWCVCPEGTNDCIKNYGRNTCDMGFWLLNTAFDMMKWFAKKRIDGYDRCVTCDRVQPWGHVEVA